MTPVSAPAMRCSGEHSCDPLFNQSLRNSVPQSISSQTKSRAWQVLKKCQFTPECSADQDEMFCSCKTAGEQQLAGAATKADTVHADIQQKCQMHSCFNGLSTYLNHNAVLNHVVKQVRVKWQTNFLSSGPTGGCGFCCDHDSPLVLCVPDLNRMQQQMKLL